ncbi:MAG: protein BatD [Ectothiorhodospiraceae bacterium]|nr:protein BatD [Ectothiorhodospiraceae bacterium]
MSRTTIGARAFAAVLGVLLALAASVATAQSLEATFERNPIHADETVRLVLELRGETQAPSPDLSPLERDFELLGTSTSTQIRIVNGRQSAQTQWLVELAPRRQGTLEAPPIRVGQHVSEARTLEVLPPRPPSGGDGSTPDIFLEVEVDTASPYRDAQVVYVVRLLTAAGIELLDGQLSEPAAADLTVLPLGRGTGYETRRGGRAYRVVERRHALFAARSGVVTLPPTTFDGEVADGGAGSSSISRLFGRGRRVRVRSEPVTLDVRPPPPDLSPWLPARSLRLEERWSAPTDALRAGEPVTRTIVLTAEGTRAEQLPEPGWVDPAGAKTYPDQPLRETGTDGKALIGRVEQQVAVVATTPGEVQLPAIRVRWWDTTADAPREAVLPARTLRVAPATPGAAMPQESAAPTEAVVAAGTAPGGGASPAVSPWQIATAAALLAWLLTVAGWWWSARRAPRLATSVTRSPVPGAGRRRRLADLRRACDAGDARAAHDAVLALAALAWPRHPPRSLGAVARMTTDPALAAALARLDAAVYGVAGDGFDPAALWNAARAGLGGEDPPALDDDDPLPPLRPPAPVHGRRG